MLVSQNKINKHSTYTHKKVQTGDRVCYALYESHTWKTFIGKGTYSRLVVCGVAIKNENDFM